MSDVAQGPGWWIASDGRWYPPELHPAALAARSPRGHVHGEGSSPTASTANSFRREHLHWVTLLLLGFVVICSTLLYGSTLPIGRAEFRLFGGPSATPLRLVIYWLCACAAVYVVTAALYSYRARRRGTDFSLGTWVLTGVGLAILMLVAVASTTNDLTVRDHTPLIPVALGLFALARVERSWPMAGFAAGFLALVMVANLYDMQNEAYRLGLGVQGTQFNGLVVGVALLAGAIGFGVAGILRTGERAGGSPA